MISEITTTRDAATVVWNMGLFEEMIPVNEGTPDEVFALVSENGQVIEITFDFETQEILWTDYLNQEERDMAAYNDQGAVSLEDAEVFFTRWAK